MDKETTKIRTVIESSDSNINTTAEMLKIKAEYLESGLRMFPKNLIVEECPFKSFKTIDEWLNSARGVWHLRNNDKEIIESFKRALSKERQRMFESNDTEVEI